MKVLLFASEQRGFTYLNSVYNQIVEQGFHGFFVYGSGNEVGEDLYVKTNAPSQPKGASGILLSRLNCVVPFQPDYLIVTRDRWPPEQSLITEIKTHYPSVKVVYVEVNSYLYSGIEVTMESLSRIKYEPQKSIDIFLDHSSNSLDTKKTSFQWEGWNRSEVVGNPQWDKRPTSAIEACRDKYKIDESKKQLLVFGTGNSSRPQIFPCLRYISENICHKDYQIFYKPLPGEKNHPTFQKDHNPHFLIEGVDTIWDQQDLYPLSYICDYHVCNLSSINHGSVFFNKQIVSLHAATNQYDYLTDIDYFVNNKNTGSFSSHNAKFWMGRHGLKDIKEFTDFFPEETLDNFASRNLSVKKDIEDCCHIFEFSLDFLNTSLDNVNSLRKYFDDFGDGRAASRIVSHLEQKHDH